MVAALLLATADRVNNPTPARTEFFFSNLFHPRQVRQRERVCRRAYRQLSPYTQMATGRVEASRVDAESAPAWPPFE